MPNQKTYIINSTFPPYLSGVGDHTAHIAVELSNTVEVKVLTACGDTNALPNIKVERVFNLEQPRSIFSVIEILKKDQPDWLILQYDPFAYGGRYGFNPYLPAVVNWIKSQCPQIGISIIVHESFVAGRTWKSLALSAWLKAQLWGTCRVADVIFMVIEPWVTKVKSWFPDKKVQHLPVSSNIPRVPTCRNEIRARLGISPSTTVLGLFGRIQRTRSMAPVIKAVNRLLEAGFDTLVLYVGLDQVGARNYLSNLPLLADGPLSAAEISQRFAAMDVYLVPIDEGVSTRRTSLMTGLQHGVPTVGTWGAATDPMLMRENGKAFLLTDASAPDDFTNAVLELVSNPSRQQLLSEAAQQLFCSQFTYKQISEQLLATLESCSVASRAG